jgi:hypothetical protein
MAQVNRPKHAAVCVTAVKLRQKKIFQIKPQRVPEPGNIGTEEKSLGYTTDGTAGDNKTANHKRS